MQGALHLGLDIGSTTAKAVVLDSRDHILLSRYCRHFSDIRNVAKKLLREVHEHFSSSSFTATIAGSGGISLAEELEIPFAQELIACTHSVNRFLPKVNVCIELGGEDAKLTFLDEGGADQRMNETCAGGTGAFIDQMATLLQTDAAGLNELAKGHTTIYPIASRCGVFAKTDIQALINDGASQSDIAASIFQAVVEQTIGGLACGRSIKGTVVFLGGPLFFLSELRERFIQTLRLTPDEAVVPKEPHLFVAMGAALISKKTEQLLSLEECSRSFLTSKATRKFEKPLPALFESAANKRDFFERHATDCVPRRDLSTYRGNCFLGIDVGSTTTKAALVSERGELLYHRYGSNEGTPLKTTIDILKELYGLLPETAVIASSTVTGYGEGLIQSALGVDRGEVETVAHAKAAAAFLPGVDFVIDIGGQDMKCIWIKEGRIDRVVLNEACSSGCGSFLQTFASSLELSAGEFAAAALQSQTPMDLGSRCTVFMNSRVRQAQKEGASVADISSGLVYSVARNALYKVLKIRNPKELGRRIVVQGGTFRNDALLRAFELCLKRDVVRPDIAELMGAFGAALIAREQYDGNGSKLISRDQLERFQAQVATTRCGGCGNKCFLTVSRFDQERSYVTGNRCERAASVKKAPDEELLPNVFTYKYRRIFDYTPLESQDAPRGEIGIPRTLNLYENYPFWFTFFTQLGFRVALSDESNKELCARGTDTVPSQTVCYPAKLAHGHVFNLLDKGVSTIFYPCVAYEHLEFENADNHLTCPVVAGYPDLISLNVDALREKNVRFLHPYINLNDLDKLAVSMKKMFEESGMVGISPKEIAQALRAADLERNRCKSDIEREGERALERIAQTGRTGIILATHPYHLDPEINHGIPEMIHSFGVAVIPEEAVAHLAKAPQRKEPNPLQVIDQWSYHSRLYRAAQVASQNENLELVQLVSFGCGLDAVTSEQVAMILKKQGKASTLIKIDEGWNNGAVRIRIRSLLAQVAERRRKTRQVTADMPAQRPAQAEKTDRIKAETVKTILCPQLSPYHFQFLRPAFSACGYDLHVLPRATQENIEEGLRYVNNDACYPAMVVTGQMISALKSGNFDLESTACFYAQTGGSCRASNYVSIMRQALDEAGFGQTPIMLANCMDSERNIPLPVSFDLVKRAALGLYYGDLLMRVMLRTRPYEVKRGSAQALYEAWSERAAQNVHDGNYNRFCQNAARIVRDFSEIPVCDTDNKPRVGIVGEILVKFHPDANNQLVETIEQEGGEAIVPDLANFLLYCLHSEQFNRKHLAGKLAPYLVGMAGQRLIEWTQAPVRKALAGSRFGDLVPISHLADKATPLVSLGNQAGEGWLLTAEMVELIESGVSNIVCVQPFACLPNHITGKGVAKALRERYRAVNITALDFDPSTSSTNQLNRIKLMMAVAKEHARKCA